MGLEMWIRKTTRRIRVKSIILSGHRKDFDRWGAWVRWEGTKPLFPLLLLILVEMFVVQLPRPLWMTLLAGCTAYWIVFGVTAFSAAFRLNARRNAFLKKAGYDLSLRSLLDDPSVWKSKPPGWTMRDWLKAQRKQG